MKSILVVTSFIAFSQAISAQGAEQSDLLSRFWGEYPVATRRLEEFYGRICLDQIEIPRNGAEQLHREIRYRSDGHSRRLDIHAIKTGQDSSWIADANRTFGLAKKQGVYNIVRTTGGLDSFEDAGKFRMKVPLPFACYSIFEMRIIDFLKESNCKITNISKISKGESDFVKVEWEAPSKRISNKSQTTRAGWFTFDAKRAWVLVDSAFSYNKASNARKLAFLTYEGEAEGIPLVRSIEYVIERNGARSSEEIAEVKNFSLKTASPDEFKLSAFGIPDGIGQPEQSRTTHFWLLGTGLLGVVLAFYLYKKQA